MTIFAVLVGLSLVLLAMGMPVAYVLGGAATSVLALRGGVTLNIVAAQLLQGTNSFVLLAIPFFVLAGNLMNRGGITVRLIRFASAAVGRMPGGLAQVAVGTNIIMAGMSGSDVADVMATGSILIPSLKQKGYPAGYAAAVIAGAGSIGPLMPPSVGLVIYSLLSSTSVVRLFIAGIVPGLMVGLCLMVMNYLLAIRRGYPTEPWQGLRLLVRYFFEALPGFVMPLIVVGGIVDGMFTATEGASVAVVYGLLVGLFVYRELKWRQIPRILLESMKGSAAVLFIIANASLFGVVLSLYQVADHLAGWLTAISPNVDVLLLFLNLVFLVMGVFVDAVAAMIILVPLLLSTIDAFGVDRIHFGVMMILNLGIGLMLPPHGLAMLIVLRFAGIRMGAYMREAWPIVLTLVLALIAVTYMPVVTLWLPTILHVQ